MPNDNGLPILSRTWVSLVNYEAVGSSSVNSVVLLLRCCLFAFRFAQHLTLSNARPFSHRDAHAETVLFALTLAEALVSGSLAVTALDYPRSGSFATRLQEPSPLSNPRCRPFVRPFSECVATLRKPTKLRAGTDRFHLAPPTMPHAPLGRQWFEVRFGTPWDSVPQHRPAPDQ
jgi:hypothetical protein